MRMSFLPYLGFGNRRKIGLVDAEPRINVLENRSRAIGKKEIILQNLVGGALQ